MPSSAPKRRRRWLWLAVPLAILLLLYCVNYILQTAWAHRESFFYPDYAKVELAPILEKAALTDEDYETLFLQTGLTKIAVDQLLPYGQGGVDQILATQEGFFTHYDTECVVLLPGRFTCEDLVLDENGAKQATVPLALAEPGDVIVSFSTHTFGWRHGHAGLVVDSARGVTLEAVVLGSDSAQVDMQHWRTYSNFMVLRVKDATMEERRQVAEFALKYLDGIPYGLTSGIFGEKAPDPESDLISQCAYLPWYAWQSAGYDLDGDGGHIVTVADLAESPLVEIVQVYGMDPRNIG
ncbi:conserved exported hypothetical protein [uncultured Eubacteriales bacterium]|uniref:Uncharacterized protein n=1 Tax=uncultured Eubacteriales bacterium TaxID=172733 RepID=A0A212K013_9FIRM|nr:conserved exported hypothetical protein [uncultured Eubacteriales bacterium]